MAVKPQAKTAAASGSALSLKDLFLTGLRKWPWILLSVAVCLGLAGVYLLTTAPSYTRTASIRIKEDSQGNSISSGFDSFADLGFVQTNTNVNDELASFESNNFMSQVVKQLNLDVNYQAAGRFHKDVLYGNNLPVIVTFPDLTDKQSVKLEIKIEPGKDPVISHIVFDKEKYKEEFTARFGKPVVTPAGKIIITPTKVFDKDEDYTLYITKSTLKGAVITYKNKLTVSLKNESGNVIDLKFVDKSVQRAEDVLNALIDIYNQTWVEEKNQVALSTSNFINDRLGVIEKELGTVDHDISSYKSANLIPDLDKASTLYLQKNQETGDQIIELGTELEMARYIKEYLAKSNNKYQAIPANIGIGNTHIDNQINEYNKKLIERNAIAANSSLKNPLVADLDVQVSSLRSAVTEAIDNHIVALQTQIRTLEKNERQTTSRIAENPTQSLYLLSVERQQKVKESLYLYLLQKREETELSQAFTAYNTRIIDLPYGSDRPSSPVKSRILILAFVIGLVFPFGVIYIQEANNTRIRDRKDIENIKAPLLGEIPFVKEKKKTDEPLVVVKEGNRNVINEAFRVLRTNLGFMTSGGKNENVIMVTSFNPGSGKTFVTVNLGISLAIKGRKVLVIDGDLRRGSTSAYIGSPRKGLSNYLVGNVKDINDVIVANTLEDGLSILPIGTVPPNPTELLETQRFRELIESLKKEYDIIFIDCPPVEMMADARIIESESDRTIFIIRADLFDKDMIPELDKLYEEKKLKNMSVILNGTKSDGHSYGYKYGYGKAYSNYYGES